MAKTTPPRKQLELSLMVDVKRPVVAAATEKHPLQVASLRVVTLPTTKYVGEASERDLSVYDAISTNYIRSAG